MIFQCDWCKKEYEESDEEQIILGQNDCKMICDSCSKFYKQTGKIYQPERSKREDSECDFCKGDCKCLLRQKKHLFITETIKNEEIVHKGPITFIV